MTKSRASLLVAFMMLLSPLGLSSAQAQESPRADRIKKIGGKFMCMCGCNQGLTQCNHVGCTTSTRMLKQIDEALQRGDSEQAITQSFVQNFGTQVYPEPPKSGFSLVAWVLPSMYLLLGTILVIFVIVRWRSRMLAPTSSLYHSDGISPEVLERGRARAARETQD